MYRPETAIGALLLLAMGCVAEPPGPGPTQAVPDKQREVPTMKLTSPAFAEGATIPKKYTCDGGDVIPPLVFSDVPHDAKSLALVVDDPDAPVGTWDHWVVWNIPATTKGIVGRNSWKKNAWGGPCPPDREHRYFFKLYALDTELELTREATKADLEREMDDHVLAKHALVGRYDRKR